MNFFEFPDKILRYTEDHTSAEDPVLKELYRNTNLKTVHPQMLSGNVQGQFLSMISRMIQPTRILEIGTFTGYSAYCLAKGLKPGGILTTIEINEELETMIKEFLAEAGIEHKVDLRIGDALDIIPAVEAGFDLIFIDANKENYVDYYTLSIDKLNRGGFMIVDNVLWGGKVAEDPSQDESTRIIHQFNELVTNDPAVENVFLTVRDGLMVLRKC